MSQWGISGIDEQALERRSLARNEALFRQGDQVTAIYFVEAGRLRLERRTFDGRSLILGVTSANAFFVEAALFADVFHCDAVAAEPSQLRLYPKAMVLNALRNDPAGALSFLALMARQVIELRQQLEVMKVRSAKDRVMLYFELNTGQDGRTVSVPGELQDIASELGLTREALYRTLASLERAGAISRSGDVSQSTDRPDTPLVCRGIPR
jgi:CRP/FNR family transcriptional regulator, dissimilatory nitrate respiration regulator